MAWSDIQVSLVRYSGSVVTLSATNPQSSSEIARVGVRVTLAGGAGVDLRSANLEFSPSETKTVNLTAPGTVVGIEDSPSPLPPQ